MTLRNALKIVSHTQPDRLHPVCIAVACMAMTAFLSACVAPTPQPVAANAAVVESYGFPSRSPCAGIVAGKLIGLGLDSDSVSSISYERREQVDGNGDRRLLGWNAWVRLDGTDGALIMRLDTRCYLEEAYTRFGLSIDGLESY